jgi:hypothetical protein
VVRVVGSAGTLDVHDRGDPFGQRAELHRLRPELRLHALLIGHVDVEPLHVGGRASVVGDDDALIADPDDAPVGAQHPILEAEGSTGLDRAARLLDRALPILRVQVPDPEALLPERVRRHTQDVFDLRTDVDRAHPAVHGGHVRDGGDLLDERAVPAFEVLEPELGLLAVGDVDEQPDPDIGTVRSGGHEDRLVADPDHAAVRRAEPVLLVVGLV